MKKLKLVFFLSLLIFSFSNLFAQDDFYDHLAGEACSCMQGKDMNSMQKEQLQMELGLCMMNGIGTFKGNIPADFDISNESSMYQLGEKVGIKMALKCPDIIMKVAELSDVTVDSSPKSGILTGTIVSFEGTDFLNIVIKDDDSGREKKFLWLRYFKGSDQIAKDYKSFIGKKVKIQYSPIECFIPKLGQYFEQNEITELSFLK